MMLINGKTSLIRDGGEQKSPLKTGLIITQNTTPLRLTMSDMGVDFT